MAHLDVLIGKRLEKIDHDLNYTVAIDGNQSDIDLHLQLFFDDYILNIYNKHKLQGITYLNELVGLTLKQVNEQEEEISFWFEDKCITVDMTDDAFFGPEAMSLHSPDGQIVVWD